MLVVEIFPSHLNCWIYWHKIIHDTPLSSVLLAGLVVKCYLSFLILVVCVFSLFVFCFVLFSLQGRTNLDRVFLLLLFLYQIYWFIHVLLFYLSLLIFITSYFCNSVFNFLFLIFVSFLWLIFIASYSIYL